MIKNMTDAQKVEMAAEINEKIKKVRNDKIKSNKYFIAIALPLCILSFILSSQSDECLSSLSLIISFINILFSMLYLSNCVLKYDRDFYFDENFGNAYYGKEHILVNNIEETKDNLILTGTNFFGKIILPKEQYINFIDTMHDFYLTGVFLKAPNGKLVLINNFDMYERDI